MDTPKFAKELLSNRFSFLSQQGYLLRNGGPGVGSDRNRDLRVVRET